MECKHQGYELSENKHAELHETWMKKLRNSSLDYNFRMMVSLSGLFANDLIVNDVIISDIHREIQAHNH